MIVGQGGKPSAGPISPPTTNTSAPEGGSASDENGVEVKRPDKAYLIANELLTTERHYVSRLHLIDQVCKILTFDFKIYIFFCFCNEYLQWSTIYYARDRVDKLVARLLVLAISRVRIQTSLKNPKCATEWPSPPNNINRLLLL